MQKEIIVAVSGGPDSMALLDILYKQGFSCIVAHVNYNVRESAKRDQNIVKSYCKKHNMQFELLTVDFKVKGNFQAKAREIRYEFLKKISKKYGVNDIYVGHHLNDHLETYIMQKKRNIIPDYYGIKDQVKLLEMKLNRPLLNYSKEDLIKYCQENQIEYGIDESNLENAYQRNLIRNIFVDKMSKDEIAKMLIEISEKNKKLKMIQKQTLSDFEQFSISYKLTFLLSLKKGEAINVLRYWFKERDIYNLSNEEYVNIITYLTSSSTSEYYLNSDYSLFKEYGKLVLANNRDYKYSIEIDAIKYKKYAHFEIKRNGSNFESVTVSEDDFPITIRNFEDGDTILMRYGSKRVSRWFIDNKIGQSKRRSWPIVINKHGEIILVPKIGCNLTHFSNNPNMFVVK